MLHEVCAAALTHQWGYNDTARKAYFELAAGYRQDQKEAR